MKRISIAEQTLKKQIERIDAELDSLNTDFDRRRLEIEVLKQQRYKLALEQQDVHDARERPSIQTIRAI